MQRRIADISTRFRVEGLSAAQREIARFTRDVSRSLRDAGAQNQLGLGPSAADFKRFDQARKETLDYEQFWQNSLEKQEKEQARVAAAAAKLAAREKQKVEREAARVALAQQRAAQKQTAAEERRAAREAAAAAKQRAAEEQAIWKAQLVEAAAAKRAAEKAELTAARKAAREKVEAERAAQRQVRAQERAAQQQARAAERAAIQAQRDAEKKAAEDSIRWQKRRADAVKELGAGMRRTTALITGSLKTVTSATTATARGFTKVGSASVKAGREAARAMTSVGKAALSASRHIAGMAKNAVDFGTKWAKIGLAAGAATGGLMGGFVQNSVKASQSLIQEQEKVANFLGMGIEQFSGFAAYAAQSGMSIEDLRQSMSQFYGVVGQAAQGGNEYARAFEQIGIATKNADGTVRPFMDVLEDFAKATAKMDPGTRARLLSQIFGDDDATKVGRLLDRMAKDDLPAYNKEVERAKKNGAVVTKSDLELSQRYRESTTMLGQAFAGLRLAIFRAFGPRMIAWVNLFTNLLNYNRGTIVNGLILGYNRFIVVLRDALKVFFGIDAGFEVQHKWMIALRERVKEVAAFIKASIPTAIEFVRNAIPLLMAEFRAFRDQALDAVNSLMATFQSFAGQVQAVFASMSAGWADFQRGFDAAAFSQVEGVLYNIGAALSQAYAWAREFGIQLYNMIALGENAVGSFTWMNDVRDWLIAIWHNASTAVSWFMEMYKAVESVFKAFNLDLGATLFFIGLLKLTGVTGLISLFIGGIRDAIKIGAKFMAFLKGGEVASGFATFGGHMAKSQAAMGGFGAAIEGLKARFAGLATFIGGISLGAILMASLAGVAAGILIWMKGLYDDIDRLTKEKLANLKHEMNASYDTYGPKAGSPMSAQELAIERRKRQQAADASLNRDFSYVTGTVSTSSRRATSSAINARYAAPMPAGGFSDPVSRTVETKTPVHLHLNGQELVGEFAQSEIDKILSSGMFSPGGA